MKTLLRIDTSLRKQGSHSRELADFFEIHWKKTNPDGKVIYRDLNAQHIPHLSNTTVRAFHIAEEKWTPEEKRAIELSNELINELKAVDQLLISSPLYNLNIPSKLKAYFDHVIRSEYTFKVNSDGSYKGLLTNKSAYLITTKGGIYKGTPMEALDFQEPYLKTICGFIGINLQHIFSLEATTHLDKLEENKVLSHQEIKNVLNQI